MSGTNAVISALGVLDTLNSTQTGNLSPLDLENLAAQSAANAACLEADVSPAAAGLAMEASAAATQTAGQVFARDYAAGDSKAEVLDFANIISDELLFVSAALNSAPATKEFAVAIDGIGAALTVATIAANHIEAAGSLVTSQLDAFASYVGSAYSSAVSAISADVSDATTSVDTALTTTSEELQTTFGPAISTLKDIGTSAYNDAATVVSDGISNIESSLSNLFTSTGAPATNFTTDATENVVVVSPNDGSSPGVSSTLSYSSDGLTETLSPTGQDGSVETGYQSTFEPNGSLFVSITNTDDTSEVATYYPDGSSTTTNYSGPDGTGSPTRLDIENADGTSQITTYNADGSSNAITYSGPNGTGAETEQDVENASGTSVITIYNADGSSTATTYSGPDGTGSPTKQDVENGDGTSQLTVYNSSGSTVTTYTGPNGTGTITEQDTYDESGNPIVLTTYVAQGQTVVFPTDSQSHTIDLTGTSGTIELEGLGDITYTAAAIDFLNASGVSVFQGTPGDPLTLLSLFLFPRMSCMTTADILIGMIMERLWEITVFLDGTPL